MNALKDKEKVLAYLQKKFSKEKEEKMQIMNGYNKIKVPDSSNILNKIKYNKDKLKTVTSKKKFLSTIIKKTQLQIPKTNLKNNSSIFFENRRFIDFPIPDLLSGENSNNFLKGIEDLEKKANLDNLFTAISSYDFRGLLEKHRKEYLNLIEINNSSTTNKNITSILIKVMFFTLKKISSIIDVKPTKQIRMLASKNILLPKYYNLPLWNNNIEITKHTFYSNLPPLQNTNSSSFNFDRFSSVFNSNFNHFYIADLLNENFKKLKIPNSEEVYSKIAKVNEVKFKDKMLNFAYYKQLPFVFIKEKSYEDNTKQIINEYAKYEVKNKELNYVSNQDTINKLRLFPEPNELFSKIKLSSKVKCKFDMNKMQEIFNKENQISSLNFFKLPDFNFKPIKRTYNEMLKEENKISALEYFYLYDMDNLDQDNYNNSCRIKIKEKVDIIFDFDSCGLVLSALDFKDVFNSSSIFEEIFKVVNMNYIYFSNFYFIFIDDLRNLQSYNTSLVTVDDITEKLKTFLLKEFDEVLNSHVFEINFYFKQLRTIGLLRETVHNILNELKYRNSRFMNLKTYSLILEILNKKQSQKVQASNFGLAEYNKVNSFEGFVLSNLKENKSNENSNEIYEQVFTEIKKVSLRKIIIIFL